MLPQPITETMAVCKDYLGTLPNLDPIIRSQQLHITTNQMEGNTVLRVTTYVSYLTCLSQQSEESWEMYRMKKGVLSLRQVNSKDSATKSWTCVK